MPIHGLSAPSFKSKRQSCKSHRSKTPSAKRRYALLRARNRSMESRGEKRPYLEVFKASGMPDTSPSTIQNEMRDVFISTATSHGIPESRERSRPSFLDNRHPSFTDVCPPTAPRADPAKYEAMEIRFMKEDQCVRLMPQVSDGMLSGNESAQHGLVTQFGNPPVQEAPLCKQTVCVEKVDVKNLLAKNREQCGNLGSSRLSEYKQTLLDFSSDDNKDTTSETKDWLLFGGRYREVSDDDDSDFDKFRDTTSTTSGKPFYDFPQITDTNLVETESFAEVEVIGNGKNMESRFVGGSTTSIDEGVFIQRPVGPWVRNETAKLERKSSFLGRSPSNQARKNVVLQKDSNIFDKSSGIAIFGSSKTGNEEGLPVEKTISCGGIICDTSETTTGVSYMTSRSQEVRRSEETTSEETGKCSDNALLMASGASTKASTHNLLTDEEITEYKRLALEVLMQRKQATEKKAIEKEGQRILSTTTVKSQTKSKDKKGDQNRKVHKDSTPCSKTSSISGKSCKDTSSVKHRPKKSESGQAEKKKDKSLSLPSSDRSFVASYRRLKKQIQKHKERLVLKHALSKFSKKGIENSSLSSTKSRKKDASEDASEAPAKKNQASQVSTTQVLPQAEEEEEVKGTKDKSSSSHPEKNVHGNIASIARVSTELNAKILSLLSKSPPKITKNVAKVESQIDTPSISTQGTSQEHDSSLLNTFSQGAEAVADLKGAKATESKVCPCLDSGKCTPSQAKPVLLRESDLKVASLNKRCPTPVSKPCPASVTKPSATSLTKQSAVASLTRQCATSFTKQSVTPLAKPCATSVSKECATSLTKQCATSLTKQCVTSLTKQCSTSLTKQCTTSLTKQCATSLTKQSATTLTKANSRVASKASISSESSGSKQSSLVEMVDHFQQTSATMGAPCEQSGKSSIDGEEKGTSKLVTHMELLQSILKSPTAKAAQAVGNYFKNQATKKCISPTCIQKSRDNISVADILSSYQKIFLELGHLSDTENLQDGNTNPDKTCVNVSDSLLRSSSNTQKNQTKPSSRRSTKTGETSRTGENASEIAESTTDKHTTKRTPQEGQSTQSGQTDRQKSPPKTRMSRNLATTSNIARGHWFRKACPKRTTSEGLRQQKEKSPPRTAPQAKSLTLSSTHRISSVCNLQDSVSQTNPQHIPVPQRICVRTVKSIQQQLVTPPQKGSSGSSTGKVISERTNSCHQPQPQHQFQNRPTWNASSKSPARSKTGSVFRGIIGRKRQEELKHPDQTKQVATSVMQNDHTRSVRSTQSSSQKQQGTSSGTTVKTYSTQNWQSQNTCSQRDTNKHARELIVSKHQTVSKGHIWNRAFRFLRSRSAERQGHQKSPRQRQNTRSSCSLKTETLTTEICSTPKLLMKPEQRPRVVQISPGYQRHTLVQDKNQDGRYLQQGKCVAQPCPKITIIESKQDMPKVESNVVWKMQKSRNYCVKPRTTSSSSSVVHKAASPRRKESSSSSSSLNVQSNELSRNSDTAVKPRHMVQSATPPRVCRATKINRFNKVNTNCAMKEKHEERLMPYPAQKPGTVNQLQRKGKKNSFLVTSKIPGPRMISNFLPGDSPKGTRRRQSPIEQANLQNVREVNMAHPKKTRIVYRGIRQRQPALSSGLPENAQEKPAFRDVKNVQHRYHNNAGWANSAKALLVAGEQRGKACQPFTAKRCHSYSGLSAKARRAYVVKAQSVVNKAAVTPMHTANTHLYASVPQDSTNSEPDISEHSAASSTLKEKLSLDDADQEEKHRQEKSGDAAETNVPVPRKWKIEPSDYSSESITPPMRTRSRRDAVDFARAKNGAVSKPSGACKLLPPKCKISFRRAKSQLSLETLSRPNSFTHAPLPRSRSSSYQNQFQSPMQMVSQKAISPPPGSLFSTDTASEVHGDFIPQKVAHTNATPAVLNRFPQSSETMVSTSSITFDENSAVKDLEEVQGDVEARKSVMNECAMPGLKEKSGGMSGEPLVELYVVTETLQTVSYTQENSLANHACSSSPASPEVHSDTDADENDDSEHEIVQSLRENTVEKTCERILWESAQNKKKSSSDSVLQRRQGTTNDHVIPSTKSEMFDDDITDSKGKFIAMKAMGDFETTEKAKRTTDIHNLKTSDNFGGCQFKSMHKSSKGLTDAYEQRMDLVRGTKAEAENSKVAPQVVLDPELSDQDAVPVSTLGELTTEHDTASTTKNLTFKQDKTPRRCLTLGVSHKKQPPRKDVEDSKHLIIESLKNGKEEGEHYAGQNTATEHLKHLKLEPLGRPEQQVEINSEESSFGPSDAIGTAPPSGVRVYVSPRPPQRSDTLQVGALSPKASLESSYKTTESCDMKCIESCVSDLHEKVECCNQYSELRQNNLDVSSEDINIDVHLESKDNLKDEKASPKKETSTIGSENVLSLRDENSEVSCLFPDISSETSSSFNFSESHGLPWNRSKREDWEASLDYMASEKTLKQTGHFASAFATHSEIWAALTEHFAEPVACGRERQPRDVSKTPEQDSPVRAARYAGSNTEDVETVKLPDPNCSQGKQNPENSPAASDSQILNELTEFLSGKKRRAEKPVPEQTADTVLNAATPMANVQNLLDQPSAFLGQLSIGFEPEKGGASETSFSLSSLNFRQFDLSNVPKPLASTKEEHDLISLNPLYFPEASLPTSLLTVNSVEFDPIQLTPCASTVNLETHTHLYNDSSSAETLQGNEGGDTTKKTNNFQISDLDISIDLSPVKRNADSPKQANGQQSQVSPLIFECFSPCASSTPSPLTSLPPLPLPPPLKPTLTSLKSPQEPHIRNDSEKIRFHLWDESNPTVGGKSRQDVGPISFCEQQSYCAKSLDSSYMCERPVCWSLPPSAGIIEIHAEQATHEQDLSSRLNEVELGTVQSNFIFETTTGEGQRLKNPSITLLHEEHKGSDLGNGARFPKKKSPNVFKSPTAQPQTGGSPIPTGGYLQQSHILFKDSYENAKERDKACTSMYATGQLLHQSSPLSYNTRSPQAVEYYVNPSSINVFDNTIPTSLPKEHRECPNDHWGQAGQTRQDGRGGAVVLLHPSENVYELYRALSSEKAFGRKKPGLEDTRSPKVPPTPTKAGAKLELKSDEPKKTKPGKMEKSYRHSDGECHMLMAQGSPTRAIDKSKNEVFTHVSRGTHALTRQGPADQKETSALDPNVYEDNKKNQMSTASRFDGRTHHGSFQLPGCSNEITKKKGNESCVVSKPDTEKESKLADEKRLRGKANTVTAAEQDSETCASHTLTENFRMSDQTPVTVRPPSGAVRSPGKAGTSSQLSGEKCKVRQARINTVNSGESVSSCESSTTQGFISSVKFLTAKLMDIVTTLSYPKHQYAIKGRSKSHHTLKRLSTKRTKHFGVKKRSSSKPAIVNKKSTSKQNHSPAPTQQILGASAQRKSNVFQHDSKLTAGNNTPAEVSHIESAGPQLEDFKHNKYVPNGDAGSSDFYEVEVVNSNFGTLNEYKILEGHPYNFTPEARNKTDELFTENDDKSTFDKEEMGVTPCEETLNSVAENSNQHSIVYDCNGAKSDDNSNQTFTSDIHSSKGDPAVHCLTQTRSVDAGRPYHHGNEHYHDLTTLNGKGLQVLDPDSMKSMSMMRDFSADINSSLIPHFLHSHPCSPNMLLKMEQEIEELDQRKSKESPCTHSDVVPPESNKETDLPASVPDMQSSELTVDGPDQQGTTNQPQPEDFLDVDGVLDTDNCRKQSVREVIYMVVPDDMSQMVQGIYMEEPVLFATPLELQEPRNQTPFSCGPQDGPRSHNLFDACDIYTPNDQACSPGQESPVYSPKPEDRKMSKMEAQDSNQRSSGSPYKSGAAREWRFGSRPRRCHYEHDNEMAPKGKQGVKEKATHHERNRHSSSPEFARFMSRSHTHRFPVGGYRMPMDRNGWYSPDLEFMESTPASDFRTCFNEMDSFSSYQPHVGFFEQDEIGFSQDYDPDTFEELGSLITEFNLSPSSGMSTETTAEYESNVEREDRDGPWWASPGFTRCTIPHRRSVPRTFVAGSAATTHLDDLTCRRALRRDLAEPSEERKDITFIKQEGDFTRDNLFDLEADESRPVKTTAEEGVQANVPKLSSDAVIDQIPSPLKCSMTQTEKEQELFEKNSLEKVEESQSQISTFMNKCLKTSSFRCYMQNVIAESLQSTLCQFKAGDQATNREENIHMKDEATPLDVTYLSKLIDVPRFSSSGKSNTGSKNVGTEESPEAEIAKEDANDNSKESTNEDAREDTNENSQESTNKDSREDENEHSKESTNEDAKEDANENSKDSTNEDANENSKESTNEDAKDIAMEYTNEVTKESRNESAMKDVKLAGKKMFSYEPKDAKDQFSSDEPDTHRGGAHAFQAIEYRHILASPPKTRRHEATPTSAKLSSSSSCLVSTDRMTYPIRASGSSDTVLRSMKEGILRSHLESPSSCQHESREDVPQRRRPNALVQKDDGEKIQKSRSNHTRENTPTRSPVARRRNRTTSRQNSVENRQSSPQVIGSLDRTPIPVGEHKIPSCDTSDSPKMQLTYQFCNANDVLAREADNVHKSRGEPILLNEYGGTETVSTPIDSPLNCLDCSDVRKSEGSSIVKSPARCTSTNQTLDGAKLSSEKDAEDLQKRTEKVLSSAPQRDASQRRCSCSTQGKALRSAPTVSLSPSTLPTSKSKESMENLGNVTREESDGSSASSMNFDYGNLGDVLSKESKCLWRRITRLESCNDRCKMCLKAYTNITSGAKATHTENIIKGLCPYVKLDEEDAHCPAEEQVKIREDEKDTQLLETEKKSELSHKQFPVVENSAGTNDAAIKDAKHKGMEEGLSPIKEIKGNSLKQGTDTKRVNFDIDKNDSRPSSRGQKPGAVMSPRKKEAEAGIHVFPTISVSPVSKQGAVLENKESFSARTNLPFPKLPSNNSEQEKCGGCCFPNENKEADEEVRTRLDELSATQSHMTGPKNLSGLKTNLLSASDIEKLMAQRDQSGCEADKFIKKLFTILQEMQATFPQGNSADVLGSVLNHSSIQEILSQSACTPPATRTAVTPTPLVTCDQQGEEKPSLEEHKSTGKKDGQLHPPLLSQLTSLPAQPQTCPLSLRPEQLPKVIQPPSLSPPPPPPPLPPPPPPPSLPPPSQTSLTFAAPYQSSFRVAKTATSPQKAKTSKLLTPTSATFLTAIPNRPSAVVTQALPSVLQKSPTSSAARFSSITSTAILTSVSPQRAAVQQTAVALSKSATPSPLSPHPQPFSPTSAMTWAPVKPALPKHRESPFEVQCEKAHTGKLKETSQNQILPPISKSPCHTSYKSLTSTQKQLKNVVYEGDRKPDKSNIATSRSPVNGTGEAISKTLSQLATSGKAYCVPSFAERSLQRSRIGVSRLPKGSDNRRPPCSRSPKEETVKMTEEEGEETSESFLKARVKKMVNQIESQGKVPTASLRNRGRFPETLAIFERLCSPSPPNQRKSLSREFSPTFQTDNSQMNPKLPSLVSIRGETLREKNMEPWRKDSRTYSTGASLVEASAMEKKASTEEVNKTRHMEMSADGGHKEQWEAKKGPELKGKDKLSWDRFSIQAKVNEAGKISEGGNEAKTCRHDEDDKKEGNLYNVEEKDIEVKNKEEEEGSKISRIRKEGNEEDACEENDIKNDLKKKSMQKMENIAVNGLLDNKYVDDGGKLDGVKNKYVHKKEIETKRCANQRISGKSSKNPQDVSDNTQVRQTGTEESNNDIERRCGGTKVSINADQGIANLKVGDSFGKGYLHKEKDPTQSFGNHRQIPLDGTSTQNVSKWGAKKRQQLASLERSNVGSPRGKNVDKSSNATARSSKSKLKPQLPTVLSKSETGMPFLDDDSWALERVSILKRTQVPLLEMDSLEELKNFSEESSEVETYSHEQNVTDSTERDRHDYTGFEPSSLCDESYQGETSTDTSTQNSVIKAGVENELLLPRGSSSLPNPQGRYCSKDATRKSRGRVVHFLLPENSEKNMFATNPSFSRGSEAEHENVSHEPADEKVWVEEECVGSRSMIDSESFEREINFPDSRTCSDSTEKLCGLSDLHFNEDLTETSYGEEMEDTTFNEEMAEKVYSQSNSQFTQDRANIVGTPNFCFKGKPNEQLCCDFETQMRQKSAQKYTSLPNSCIHQDPEEMSHGLPEAHIYQDATETLFRSTDSLISEYTKENGCGPAESLIDQGHNKKVCSQAEYDFGRGLSQAANCGTDPCTNSGPSKEVDDFTESDLHQAISERFSGFRTASVNPHLTQKARYCKPASHQNFTHVNSDVPASSMKEGDAVRRVRSSEDSPLGSDWTDALSSRPELGLNSVKFSTSGPSVLNRHPTPVKATSRSVPNVPFLNARTGHRIILPRSPSGPSAEMDCPNTPAQEHLCPDSGQHTTDPSPSDVRNPCKHLDPTESTRRGIPSPSFAESPMSDPGRQGTPSCVLEEFYQRSVVPVKIPLDIYTLPRKVASTANSGSKKRKGDKAEPGPTRTIVISGPINDLSLAVNRHVAQDVPDSADHTGGMPQAGARMDNVSGGVYDPASIQHEDASCPPPTSKSQSGWMKAVRRIMPFKKRGRADASLHNQ